MRTEPPPSEPCAIGRRPAATAAPAPPLDPPGVWSRFHGLRVGGWIAGSVTGSTPNSDVAVFPSTTNPPRLTSFAVGASIGDTNQRYDRDPSRVNVPRIGV